QHLLGIPPDLRIESRVSRVEHADHGPVARGEAQRFADAGTLEALCDGATSDDLGGPRPEHPPFDEPHLRAQHEPDWRDAAYHDVRRLARATFREVDENDGFLRDELLPILPDRD